MEKIRNISEFHNLCDWCTQIEPKLEPVIRQFGHPPFWHREPNFATLILTILEQQVSLASAKAAYIKLETKIEKVTPENFLLLTDEELRECYFSRQKLSYSRILAKEIVSGNLILSELNKLTDREIRSKLIQLKGIGNWTIDMYLLMSLHFSDIFPPGDLATIKSVYELNLVSPDKSKDDITKYMKIFSPYQSAATYILWHSYIEQRNLKLE
ncbi:MAG: hypothetical protein R2757_02515 [Draconibacterium sp.]